MGEHIQNVLFKTKNPQGDILTLYPMTKVENVMELSKTLDNKADKSSVYTKTEIDEIIAKLQDSEEGHFFKAEENEF